MTSRRLDTTLPPAPTSAAPWSTQAITWTQPPHRWPEHERHTRWPLTALLLANPSDPDLWATADGEVL